MNKAKFGLIGAGKWGEVHVQAYRQHPNADIIAICDLNEERASQLAQKYNIKKYYTDYQKMIEDNLIDAVSVATPDFAHKDPVIFAARNGKHVIVEKPLALSSEDGEAMVKAAKEAKVKLMVDFHNRWNHPYVAAKEALEDGEMGELQLAYGRQNSHMAELSWLDKTEIIWFVGSHTIDLMTWFFNDKVEQVYSISRSRIVKEKTGVDTPDFYETILEFKNGGVGIVENTWLIPSTDPAEEDFQFELVGSEGSAYLDTFHDRSAVIYGREKPDYPDMFVKPRVYNRIVGFAVQSVQHFVDSIVGNFEPWSTGEDGLVNIKIIEAAVRSAEIGQPVKVNY